MRKLHIKLIYSMLLCLLVAPGVTGQAYAPAAEMEGSTAIHMDSELFLHWAASCRVQRGPGNIMYPDSIKVDHGMEENATGKADITGVVSLGDGGVAVLEFHPPIRNGAGFDFAVFENAFSDNFLELAFVEVSTDGIRYSRFPAVSETDTGQQIGSFGLIYPENIHHLAGKYRAGYGTGFDLDEIEGISPDEKNNIGFVRIIDVIGILNDSLGSRDSRGHLINDPWPTAFETGGFDLDAVGVIHSAYSTTESSVGEDKVRVFPNPCRDQLWIEASEGMRGRYSLVSPGQGRTIASGTISGGREGIGLERIAKGIYLLRIEDQSATHNYKIIKL